jgi:hypothetical protein
MEETVASFKMLGFPNVHTIDPKHFIYRVLKCFFFPRLIKMIGYMVNLKNHLSPNAAT